MPSKKISLEIEAYNRLKATQRPGESISDVVRRVTLPAPTGTLRDVKKSVDAGTFGKGVDWVRVKRAVARRSRSRDLRPVA